MSAILPGSVIGFLGGGQLARMSALAARSMGYDVHVLDPDPDCPAAAVASHVVTARYDDVEAATAFAQRCDVITLDIEQVATDSIAAASLHAPVHPGAAPIHIIQDRGRQKQWLEQHGFPVAPFRIAHSPREVAAAYEALGRSIAKTTSGGYDGRGQARIRSANDLVAAGALTEHATVVVEQWIELAGEVSVMVARSSNGEVRTFPVSYNHHDNGVLTWAMTPAPVSEGTTAAAIDLATRIAGSLDIVGLLAVEMFVTTDDTLMVNELAPRPHNTFHATERACLTSQFEQQVRAVCGLPLGSTALHSAGAIVNLLGDLWRTDGQAPEWERALEIAGVRLHLYGKKIAKPGRKMGHLSAIGATPDAARDTVLDAYSRLLPQ
ncbi:MAG TPA: 5-(carboxyamino)imidazole ribonucleotide synthase [Gemmatimonadaceae bacterium]|nr:5-(carboxyamino)imidazole ribonucleotide synthase [Gemmatimonadaceae bacterium]